MALIAYVDHSYHKKTISTKFIPDILIRRGHTVDFFWDESWQKGKTIPWESVAHYDAIVMFQSCIPTYGAYFAQLHPNVTYIPMLDQFGGWCGPLFNLTEFWEPFQGCKILNFSSAIHSMVTGFGIKSLFVRYYQQPLEKSTCPHEGLRGFFWLRREEQIPWSTIRTLIGGTQFDSFHLHLATDPGTPTGTLPSEADLQTFNITVSTWFDDKAAFDHILDRTNVFFTPRAEEGIGQAMLEAFSRGQCVVAPNQGTMNEYILSGVNGLLYDLGNPVSLDFSKALEIGATGWKAAQIGFQEWQRQESEIVNFLLTPSAEMYLGKYNHFQNKAHNTLLNKRKKWLKDKLKELPGGKSVIQYAKNFIE
jgi:hypothetical protein